MTNASTDDMKSPPMKVKGKGKDQRMEGVGTLLQFANCQGIIMAANMNDLRKLARSFFLADFDPKLARKITIKSR